MHKAFKYRLYPNREQAVQMERLLKAHRTLYNAALEHRQTAYRRAGVSITYFQQCAELKDIRREDADLALCNYCSCQATLRRLDRAFKGFFHRLKAGEKPGYPRFKSRDRFDTVTFPAYGDGCKLTGNRVTFQGVGSVKIKLHRPVEGTIKTVSFKLEAKQWYVVLASELGDAPPLASVAPSVGIDLGLRSFIATSDGEVIAAPQFAREAQRNLRRSQRALSRCKRGSKRRQKVKRRVTRHYQHVANQRRDFHHKTARALVNRYGTIAHEDLNVRGIARSRLARSTHDAGWAQFLEILTRKAEEAGVAVVSVDPRNTTQACSDCGCLPAEPLTLKVRVYHCASCGYSADRDLNAARNIKSRLGLSRQARTPAIAEVA